MSKNKNVETITPETEVVEEKTETKKTKKKDDGKYKTYTVEKTINGKRVKFERKIKI